jgi:hypothetical protein
MRNFCTALDCCRVEISYQLDLIVRELCFMFIPRCRTVEALNSRVIYNAFLCMKNFIALNLFEF